jgi:serine/threonine protein kinase
VTNSLPQDANARFDPDLFADDLKQGTQLLDGQYTILGFLNSGGFGITYLAKDSLDRTVVIKECFPNSLCRRSASLVRARSRKHTGELRSFVENFLAEARSLARLVHPNIVGIHQVFEDNDTAYMVIDFIDGQDMLDIMNSTDRPFSPDQVVTMLKKLLSAVEFIHQSGLLHRDISPDNILIDKTGNPVLIDFGAAAEKAGESARVLTGRRVVKDGYSPQEFYMTGAEHTYASDLYALGATFYHVISGKPPAESQRRLAMVAEGSADPYVPLAGRFEGFPTGFLEAIDKASQVLPKDRFASAGAWIDAIAQGEAGHLDPQLLPPGAASDAAAHGTTAPRAATVDAGKAVSSNLGYVIGAGVVFVAALVLGIWSVLD